MKNINIIFLSLLAAPALQALDFPTDPAFAKLKTAIEQARSLEKVQETWNGVTTGLSQSEKTTLAQQATTYALEQKLALEQTLTALGDKNYDASKLKWGAAQTAFGLWCVASLVKFLILSKHNQYLQHSSWINLPLFPLSFPLLKFNNHTNIYPLDICVFIGGFLTNLIAPYFLYKGIKNLYQGLNHKQILETKINNLTATIDFLQSLTNGTISQQ